MKDTSENVTEVPTVNEQDRLNEPGRLEALRRMGVMEGIPADAQDRAVRLASRLLDVPVSLVSFVDDTQQVFAAQTGLPAGIAAECRTPLSHSICQHVVRTKAPLAVSDARRDPLLRDNGAVRDLGVVAYLGVPIHAPNGLVLGSFCAIDMRPRDWREEDIAHLRDIAEMIESDLRLRDALDERDVVLQEMTHRVKNLFTIVNSILRMERSAHESAADLAASLGARLKALSDAHEMIVPLVDAPHSHGATTTLDALMNKLLAPYVAAHEDRLQIRGEAVEIGPKAAVYLTLAVHELATNATKYGGLSLPGGRLSVSWDTEGDDTLVLHWKETGHDRDARPEPKPGFGTRLLSVAVEGQLAGRIETEVSGNSFRRWLRIPLSRLKA